MAPKVTIKTIARDLGISHMTVSRALSNHPSVSDVTREKILKHAAAVGYVKNAAAGTMRGDGTRIVGLLLPNLVNEFYARFANDLALACEASSLHLVIHLTDDNWDKELTSLLRLREVQADAVVMVPTPRPNGERNPHLENLHVAQLIRTRNENFPVASLAVNDSPSIVDAVKHLVSRGHRDIAYIGATRQLSSGKQRYDAFAQGMSQFGLDVNERLVKTDVPTFAMGSDSVTSILEREKNASALICGGFEVSNGALEACLKLGVSMPEELAFVGYGDSSMYQWVNGGITTIDLPTHPLAEKAVSLIERMRHGERVKTKKELVECHLEIRRSS